LTAAFAFWIAEQTSGQVTRFEKVEENDE